MNERRPTGAAHLCDMAYDRSSLARAAPNSKKNPTTTTPAVSSSQDNRISVTSTLRGARAGSACSSLDSSALIAMWLSRLPALEPLALSPPLLFLRVYFGLRHAHDLPREGGEPLE